MHPIEVTDQSFDAEVLSSAEPVVVDFWAPWCGPCQVIAPFLDELATEYSGRVKFVKLNVDDNPQKAGQFQVLSIPNLKIFKGGAIQEEVIGMAPKDHIKKVIDSILK